MNGTILVGGGSGFIGTAFSNLLRTKGYGVTVISRMPGPQRLSWTELAKNGLPEGTMAVVNLAGQNVLDPLQRWTPGFKQNVWSSRVNTTKSLADAIIRSNKRPKSFVTISGVGIYEPSMTKEYTEESRGEEFDFLSKLCHEWENAAKLPSHLGVRTATVRSGVVLGRNGGMIKQLYVPFFLGVGGRMGSGKQWMPWIHIDDLTNLLLFAIENPKVKGVLNGVAPELEKGIDIVKDITFHHNSTRPASKSLGDCTLRLQQVTNKQFTSAFGKALWRPALIPIPEFALNMAFSEERAKMMVDGQKVVPKRTLEYGFRYKYPDIDSACKQCSKLVSK